MKRLIFLFLTLPFWAPIQAQSVVYSLPQTCIQVTAEAQCTQFMAGPYAKFARKYLGMEAQQENKTTYELIRVAVTPYLEADPSQLFTVVMPPKSATESWLLQMTSQGLVLLADSYVGKDQKWRFPSQSEVAEVTDAGIIENLKQERTTLYRADVKGQSVAQVPVQQNQLVEKTLEQRADEAARHIFRLREQRMAIITGDTDATFSGEALGAAVAEMRRMEDEYLALFLGNTTVTTSELTVDVLPSAQQSKYIAFRISDTEGLLPAINMGGRPIVLDVAAIESPSAPALQAAAPSAKGTRLMYRVPVVMQLRLLDGQQELLQTRMPIYQMGPVLDFAIN